MNLLHINKPLLQPLKVLVVNPLAPASQLFIVKMMSGVVFSDDQLIDLNLIVSSNDLKSAESFVLELESCAFSCTNSIKISSDMSSANDADVFCFITDFDNPNYVEFDNENIDKEFNALYLIIKLANSFSWLNDTDTEGIKAIKNAESSRSTKKHTEMEKIISNKEKKAIFLVDGIVAIDILQSLSKNMPSDIFFCPTPISAIAKSVLGDYLNVHCNVINDVLVWAANDNVFHVEVKKPIIIHDDVSDNSHCDEDKVIGKDLLEQLNLDSTQFSASWLKKEFIEKVASSASKNPYGCIYRAVVFSKTLRDIWLTRIQDDGKKVYNNMGVISDGSLGTIKGLPYVLPVVFTKGNWSVNKLYEDDVHLKQEINRINKEVKQRHDQMIAYCKKFLQDNIIHQPFTDEYSTNSMSSVSGYKNC
ncbi:malate dehydrogenase 3, cytoplasmic-like [Melitaea cinxia]|uniref:malate dehydrogenase 3, cytoplasmic-like n=1 Tax=Melitaea cinxia TaxID=113334 RepID=UPI001E271206|nr:malate dehydrogenase 3, cytoplasmic-like [Melitaea cinxia]